MAARFFCDNCGEEVKRNASRCSRCGRYFASVRCPECGFTGEEKHFAKGCPVCGYCEAKQEPDRLPQAPSSFTRLENLPRWVYVVSAVGLFIVGLILYYKMR
ncbi:MAG: hypothetical protein LBB72_04465 [Spirochaetaceae bacterium]|jgi:predicted amidophosphoribosyltransferase|nr:hypothetical protein [Spirochaetaceae bacterium]